MEGSVSLKQGLADLSEIEQYARDLDSFRNLQIDAERFTAIRLQMGCYGQRQEGVNMLRIKIPGGRLTPGTDAHDRRRAGQATRNTTWRMSPRARTSRSTTFRWSKRPTRCATWPAPGSPRARPVATPSATSPPARWPACARRSTPTSITICRRRYSTFCATRSTSSCRASSRSASPAASRTAPRA